MTNRSRLLIGRELALDLGFSSRTASDATTTCSRLGTVLTCVSIAELLCDHFRMSKSDFFGGQGNIFFLNWKKKKSCLKLPDLARKLIENVF